MQWEAKNPGSFAGKVVGSGQCVDYVRQATGAPHTSNWKKGDQTRSIWPSGLAIATFDTNDKYANAIDGSSHTAILISVLIEGLRVWDQWVGHPVAQRTIRFKSGVGLPCDDGDRYYAVETADA